MPSSALSGNTSGLATSTSPGLVGTGAQTWAGKKTLDGGAAIKGDTSGSAVAAGYVGQKITWATPPATQGLTTTLSDWTNANIVLTAGVWFVTANIAMNYATAAVTGSVGSANVQITDSLNNIIQNMDKQVATQPSANAAATIITSVPMSFVAVLSDLSTTYKIRVKRFDSGAAGSGNVYNQATAYSEFFAVRIA